MAKTNGAEVLGAAGYATRGPVSAAAAVGCALINVGSDQLGFSSAPAALLSGAAFTGAVSTTSGVNAASYQVAGSIGLEQFANALHLGRGFGDGVIIGGGTSGLFFGGRTAAHVALKSDGVGGIKVRTGDDLANARLETGDLKVNGPTTLVGGVNASGHTLDMTGRQRIVRTTDGTQNYGQGAIRIQNQVADGNTRVMEIGVGDGGQGLSGIGWIHAHYQGQGSVGTLALQPRGGFVHCGQTVIAGAESLYVRDSMVLSDPTGTMGVKNARVRFSANGYGPQAWIAANFDRTFFYEGMALSVGVKAGADVAGAVAEERWRFCSDGEFRQITAAGATELQIFPGGIVKFGAYTFLTLPSAATFAGGTLRVSDRGNRLVTSDGTNWNWAGTLTAAS